MPEDRTDEGRAPEPAADPRGPKQDARLAEYASRLRREVASLPERQRLAFVLHTYQGLAYAEDAEVMVNTRDIVKVLMSLARKRLRERMGEM